MGAESDPRLLVLHALRLKGVAHAEAVSQLCGLPVEGVRRHLAELSAAGLAVAREGRLAGWSLTTAGRAEHERALGEELDALLGPGGRPMVEEAYRRFLALNPELLELCTRWQVRDLDGAARVNDHRDASYDAAVVEGLAAVHERVLPVLEELEAALARFGRYRPALQAALDAVRRGELDMFAKPIVPSYHTIWFELHEDLLATLGLDRCAAARSP